MAHRVAASIGGGATALAPALPPRGAYSHIRAGGIEAARAFAVPVQDTLYFAGEATAPRGQFGTVHGALASGRQAACRILSAVERAHAPARAARMR